MKEKGHTPKPERKQKPRKNRWDELDMDNHLDYVEALVRNGATDKQIAEKVGVSERTFNDWKHKHPLLVAVLKRNKEFVDLEVESALLKEAKAGNVTAQIFWLKNRQKDHWRDKWDIDFNLKDERVQILPPPVLEIEAEEVE